ncbi:MAG TPA: ABC transporter permease [Verrucomicrobiae bacterium]
MATPAINPKSAVTDDVVNLSPWQIMWRRLKQRKLAMLGGVILIILYTMAAFAGFIAPYGYERQDRERFFHPPTMVSLDGIRPVMAKYHLAEPGTFKYEAIREDRKPIQLFVQGEKYKFLGLIPSTTHLFGTGDDAYPVYLLGTDQYGRDIFSRMLYGAQISLSIGLIGILLSYGIGVFIGAVSGYYSGKPDAVIMRFCELIMSIPGLYLILALRATFPSSLSSVQMYLLIVVILSFVGWAGTARVIRGMALSLRERQYVLAARALGQTDLQIVMKHIIPGTFSYLIVGATLSIPYYILGEVVLSYLTVGIQEPEASWGNMLSAAQNTEYLREYPWLLAPGGAIFITVLAFNFLGDGLRDAVDTKSA